jgi:hypothetical protein
MFGNFLAITACFRLVRASAVLWIIDQIPKIPNFSSFVVVLLEVFRLGTKMPSVCSDADRNRPAETQRTSRRSACYVLGTTLADLFGAGGARRNQKIKLPKGETNK